MSKPEVEGAVVFQLVQQDIQEIAHEEIGRPLTQKELRAVTKLLDKGFDSWYDFLSDAIREVVEE